MADLVRTIISLALATSAATAATDARPSEAEIHRAAQAVRAELRWQSATSSHDLAAELMRRAKATPYTPAARFALLAAARDLSAQAGDAVAALAAARELAAEFGLDELTETSDALAATAPHVSSRGDFAILARLGRDVVNRRLAVARTADDYASAATLATAAATWDLAGDDAALQVKAQAWARDVRAVSAEAARIAPALERLQATPDDPDANLAIGRLLCFYQADWARGLPHLVKGSDASLAVLSELESSHGPDPTAWAQLGDGWWEQGRALEGDAKRNVWRHACAWYAKAYPRAIGPRRALIERRAAEAGISPSDWESPVESP